MNGDREKEYAWVWSMLDSYLARKNLKQTKQRKIILEAFMEAKDAHMDAETVHGILSQKNQNIGLATVYRSLNLLKDAGILEQHTFADGRAIFELCHPESHHDHLVCVECGVIREFENEQIEEIQKEIAARLGYELTSHRLELFGKCLDKKCPNRQHLEN